MAQVQELTVGAGAFKSLGDTFYGSLADPYPLFARYRAETPVRAGDIAVELGVPSRASAADGSRPVFSLFGYRDIQRVLRDDARFSSGLLLDGLGAFVGRIITGLDGDEHRRARALLQPAFMPSVLDSWKQQIIQPILQEMLAPIRPAGRADLLKAFALPFPVRIIYAVMGFPPDPEALDQFSAWALAILAGPQLDPEKAVQTRKAAFQAAQELYDHMLPIIAARRAAGAQGQDMIASLLRAEHDGHTLSDEEIAVMVRMLLPAAAETTTRSFSSLLALLFQRPQVLERIRSDRSLIPAAVNEALRFEPSVSFLYRQAVEDTEIGGVAIPAGAGLTLAIASGNRDESVFPDADRFDIDRRAAPALGFGYGVHMCIGMMVAKAEMAAALDAVLDELPGLEPDGDPPPIVGVHFRSPAALRVRWQA